MSNFEKFCKDLEETIKAAYEERVTTEQAEELAAKFLHAMMVVSSELRLVDLDARMKKQNVKAIRGAIYLDIISKSDKKPTEAGIAAMLDTNELVQNEQKAYDQAEVLAEEVERTYNVCKESHIFFRTLAKGTMG
jgi:hypothetical protein